MQMSEPVTKLPNRPTVGGECVGRDMPESTSFLAVEDLDAAGTLAAAEAVVRDRRALEVRELELALHWADLHADDLRHAGQPTVPGRPGWSDATGTHELDPAQALEQAHPGALEAALEQLQTEGQDGGAPGASES
jgi:hypothetical protein